MSSSWVDKYELKRAWDLESAEYHYELRRQIIVSHEGFRATREMRTIARGGKPWAERTAAHFNINVEGIEVERKKYE